MDMRLSVQMLRNSVASPISKTEKCKVCFNAKINVTKIKIANTFQLLFTINAELTKVASNPI